MKSLLQEAAEEQIKAGTLKVDNGDGLTEVLGPKKSGYARGVGGGVTVKTYFNLPRNRKAYDDARFKALEAELAAEKRKNEDKDKLVSTLSSQVTDTQAMVIELKSRLDALTPTVPALQERFSLFYLCIHFIL